MKHKRSYNFSEDTIEQINRLTEELGTQTNTATLSLLVSMGSKVLDGKIAVVLGGLELQENDDARL